VTVTAELLYAMCNE